MRSEPKRTFTEFVQIYENKLVFYAAPADGMCSHRLSEDYVRITTNKKYTGLLPDSGKKKIEKRLTAWIFSIMSKNYSTYNTGIRRKHYPTFITLTYPSLCFIDDKWLKKNTLELFIKQLQSQYNIKHYFWKAERQKRGVLHFHLLLDKYIDKKSIQKRWNSILDGKGLLEKFKKDHGHNNPPSTHIKGMEKRKLPVSYIMKYCYEKSDTEKINGLVYRFSNSLMHLCNYSNFAFGEISDSLSEICIRLTKKSILTDQCRIVLLKSQLNFFSARGKLKDNLLRYYLAYYLALYPT